MINPLSEAVEEYLSGTNAELQETITTIREEARSTALRLEFESAVNSLKITPAEQKAVESFFEEFQMNPKKSLTENIRGALDRVRGTQKVQTTKPKIPGESGMRVVKAPANISIHDAVAAAIRGEQLE